MTVDAVADGAYATVLTPPSPATSGTSLVVETGEGTVFPTPPFDLTMWPPGVLPLTRGPNANAEIGRCTNVSTDTVTVTRNAYGYGAKAVAAGWQCGQLITANLLGQIEALAGASAGSMKVHKALIQFDDPGLATGEALTFTDGWTQTVGELLFDAGFIITTPWNGATPLLDASSFVGTADGWFRINTAYSIDATVADLEFAPFAFDDPNLISGGGRISGASAPSGIAYAIMAAQGDGNSWNNLNRELPAMFVDVNPIKAVCSSDGTTTGGDPGSTQGNAIFYLVTALPA